MPSCATVLKKVPEFAKLDVFRVLAERKPPIAPPAIRRGDVGDPTAKTSRQKEEVLMEQTTVATFLFYLQGVKDGQQRPRFQPQVDVPHVYMGYHIDDWFRAMAHFLYFLGRRDGTTMLDSSQGPKGHAATHVSVFPMQNTDSLVDPAVLASNLPENQVSRMQLAFSDGLLKQMRGTSTHQRRMLYSDEAFADHVYLRTATIVSAAEAKRFDRRRIRDGQGTTRDKTPFPVPPIHPLNVHLVLDHKYRNQYFDRPVAFHIEADIRLKFPNFFGQDADFTQFMATQAKMVDRLAEAAERRDPTLPPDQVRRKIEEEVELCHALLTVQLTGRPFSSDSDAEILEDACRILGWTDERIKDPGPEYHGIPFEAERLQKLYC